jgi:hypothetical protein
MSDNAHVADICWVVHQFTELFSREVDHCAQRFICEDMDEFSETCDVPMGISKLMKRIV